LKAKRNKLKKEKFFNVLVTGGLGFIGSNLAIQLSNNNKVTIVDDLTSPRKDWKDLFSQFNNIEIVQSCFSDLEILSRIEAKEFDYVFHLAALPSVIYSVENPEHSFEVNVVKTMKLVDACSKAKINKFIFSSSSAIYGNSSSKIYSHNGTSETDDANPVSPYAWHKLTIENYLSMVEKLYGLNSISLRYFNVFGPGQFGGTAYSNAIAAWCHCVKNEISLRSDGDGKQSRDMVHVDNVVSANILAMNSKLNGIYNVGTGLEYSNEAILKYFTNNFKNITVVNAPERAGDVKRTKANINKISNELNYKPVKGFWEGLSETWKWWGLK
jgi:UDP-glucose 4-epimerase